MIAKYSKKVNTPRLYIYLLRQMGLDKSLDVKVEFLPMKQYLGLVELDEHTVWTEGIKRIYMAFWVAAVYDYGQNGVELKNNIKQYLSSER